MTPKPTSPVTSTRAGDEMIQADSSASEKVCDHPSTEKAAPDIVERLRDRVSDANSFGGRLLKEWDAIRAACLKHRGSDLPRRMFEGQIENFTELMTEAADEIERLRAAPPDGQVIAHPANSLRSLPESSEPSLLGRETVREASSVDWHQQRGRHFDIIQEAIATYDDWMLDDDYDATSKLHQIIKKMRERASLSPLKE